MIPRLVGTLGALTLLLLLAVPVLAQDGGTVAGRVVDAATQQPLSGVQVTVTGTTRNTITNAEGRYILQDVPAGDQQVRATRIGYTDQTSGITVVAGETAVADFELESSALELGGIIVTATGQEQRRREIGNSVGTIEVEDVEMGAVETMTNLLQGRAAGVNVLPTSGSVGTGSRIRIRGNSSVSLEGTPLIIMDGIRVSNETESSGLFTGGISTTRWDDLNPEDIESVEVLKGPAASALYGTAAANGVVQITTRRGQRGSSVVRAYVSRSSLNLPSEDVPANYLAVAEDDAGALTACSYVEIAEGECLRPDTVYSFNPLLEAPNTPLRDGHLDKVGLSVSGGSPMGEVTYFFSLDSERGPGTIRDNELDRQSFRANVSSGVTEQLRLSAATNFVSSYIQLPQEGNTGSGAWLNALFGSPLPSNVERGGGFSSPYTAENVGWWQNEEELRRFTASLTADWRPTAWLHVNGVAGVDQVNRFEQSTIPVPGLPTGFQPDGLREQFRTQDREFTTNLNANVTRDLNERVVSTTALGIQYNESQSDWTYGAGAGLAPGTLAPGQALSVQEFFGETKLFGVYGSQQLALNDRLFVTAAVRGDQNSAFGENIGFVTYPAVSASWVVDEEPAFPELPVLSNLRLRAAYGESGQRPGRLDALRVYEAQAVALAGQITSGFIVDNAGNPDLTAEVTSEVEFGMDLGFFDDRVALQITRWSKNTEDALVLRPLPPSVGGPSAQFFNLGEVESDGWEAQLRLEALRTERFGADLRINYATNQNTLVTYGDTAIPPITFGLQRHVEGFPLGGYWTTAYDYEDANGDGLIQPTEVFEAEDQDDADADISYLGSPHPRRELSFTGTVSFRDIATLSALLDHKAGHKLFNWTARIRCGDNASPYCEARQVPGAASLEEQAAIMARQELGTSAGFVEDADFWKLREVSLRIAVPRSFVERVRYAEALSITVAGRNLRTWSDYGGPDPEVNIPGSVSAADDPGRFYAVDLTTMPAPRVWTVRFDVGF